MVYDGNRGIFISHVKKAIKDNVAVKKGEPYILVKRTKFAITEYFKDENSLDKVYPKFYRVNVKTIQKLLKEYNKILNGEDRPLNEKNYIESFISDFLIKNQNKLK